MFAAVTTPAEMSRWDALALEYGVPEDMLMENAARAALSALREEVKKKGLSLRGARVMLIMGGGNNGGDAAALSRHLQDAGAVPLVLFTRAPGRMRGAAGRAARLSRKLGIPFRPLPDSGNLAPACASFLPDIVIDGLLGTGFHGELRPRERNIVRGINALRRRALIFSIDIPSGLNGNNGSPQPEAVRAHGTVTFQAAKPALLLPSAREFVGSLHVRTIGTPLKVMDEAPASRVTWLDDPELSGLSSPLPLPRHKGEAGRVLIIGGCAAMSGAPRLAALGALRAGAGLPCIAAPEGAMLAIRCSLPEVITHSLPAASGGQEWHAGQLEGLRSEISRCLHHGALVVGPGMGRDKGAAEFLRALLQEAGRPPLVLDADALYALAQEKDLPELLTARDVLTPHPGEAATLLGLSAAQIQSDRFAALEALKALAPACWVLKGEGSLCGAEGSPVFISRWSAPNLAVGGSGDVLSGVIAALLAAGHGAAEAAALGVEIHARAGAALAADWPHRGNSPQDIADAVAQVISSVLRESTEMRCTDYDI